MSSIHKTRMVRVLLIAICFVSAPETFGQQLKAMTYNVRFDNPGDGENAWEHRKAYLISQIAWHAPDLVGTQEALLHQLEDMDAGLPGYRFFGRGRDVGPGQGEYSAVFYRTDRLLLEASGTFWLSETPEIPSRGWDAALNRICTYGRFRHRETGRRFYLFNTHFDHRGQQARQESVALILAEISRRNPESLPVILTGDLNLEPEDPAIGRLSHQMQDTRVQAGDTAYGPEGTFNGFDCTRPANRRIDYVFISPDGFGVSGHATLSDTTGKGFPSDHFPVLATLSWPE